MSAEKPMSGAVEGTEMELRVAEAISAESHERMNEDISEAQSLRFARAAIRAMREPTEAMVNYAYDRDMTGGKAACERMWMDMIKAATASVQESATAAVPLK